MPAVYRRHGTPPKRVKPVYFMGFCSETGRRFASVALWERSLLHNGLGEYVMPASDAELGPIGLVLVNGVWIDLAAYV